MRLASWVRAAGAAAILAILGGCATSPSTSARGGSGNSLIDVVAAENFWGSLAEQLGGSHVRVTTIIDNPDADPHDYEPTAADARAVAGARLVVVNGVGYDAWAGKLADAVPSDDRTMLNVGDLAGVKA